MNAIVVKNAAATKGIDSRVAIKIKVFRQD